MASSGHVYPLEWTRIPENEPPDVSGLPSIDHALYLFNTVKFHLGQHYRFFEDGTFIDNLHEFYYNNAQKKASEARIWFAQFLIVLAFGNAFLSTSRHHQGPPGKKYFVRALALMPEHASLWKDSLVASETLALAAIYFYSIDHRESAGLYVSLFHFSFPSSIKKTQTFLGTHWKKEC